MGNPKDLTNMQFGRLHDPEILERFHDLTPERQKEFKEYLRQTVSTLLADQLG